MMSIVMIPQTTRSRTEFHACWTGVTTQIHMFAKRRSHSIFYSSPSLKSKDFKVQISFYK